MLPKAIFKLLDDDSGIGSVVADRISPYVRNREDEFPCIVYTIDNQETTKASDLATLLTRSDVTVTALARSMITAENVGSAIASAVTFSTPTTKEGVCMLSSNIQSIRRDFGDPFDGSADLVYRVHVETSIFT